MCLLIVLAQIRDDLPLVVAANRDERLDRPAVAMTVLQEAGPRIVGGRDEVAGGTWLAVNDAGVVAGLTNRPTEGGPDKTKRSRGELPLRLARHLTAAEAAQTFESEIRPTDYNPAWLLVGDRRDIFWVDVTGTDVVVVEHLGPGIHVLENKPLHADSLKVAHVRSLLGDVASMEPAALVHHLQSVLADHHLPEGAESPVAANCVHTEKGYGTRWSGIVTVGRDPAEVPSVHYADGPPCTTPWAR